MDLKPLETAVASLVGSLALVAAISVLLLAALFALPASILRSIGEEVGEFGRDLLAG